MDLVRARLGALCTPMRSVLLALITAGALVMPVATAEAACGCRQFAQSFNRSSYAQLTFQLEADNRGVSRQMQARIKRGIYDWERGGYPARDSFWKSCSRNTFCRKLRAS